MIVILLLNRIRFIYLRCVPLIMKRLALLIVLGHLLCTSCTTEYNDYYYDSENLHWFICSHDHYIVAKDRGDSLQIWNLTHQCNSGYGAADIIRVAKKVGATGQTQEFKFKIEITKITDKRIGLNLKSGGQEIDFNLSRQRSTEKPFRVINIVQMQDIDVELEKYIHMNSMKAESNMEYLFKGYSVDDNVETLNPNKFFEYYRTKRLTEAQTVIKKLSED